MEMGFHHDAWPISQGCGTDSGAVDDRLDWQGLRARFLAARAFRQHEALRGQHAAVIADASFDRSAAEVLAQFDDALRGINLDSSADGKGLFGNNEDVADASKCGDRG